MAAAAQFGARFEITTVSGLTSVGRPFVFLSLSEIYGIVVNSRSNSFLN